MLLRRLLWGRISVTKKYHLWAAPEQSEIMINSEWVYVNCLSVLYAEVQTLSSLVMAACHLTWFLVVKLQSAVTV